MNESADEASIFAPATQGDIEAMAAIDRGSPRPWTVAEFEAELSHHPPTLFVLRASGRVVAFVVTRVQTPEMDIVNVAVDPKDRRRGFGLLLIRSLLAEAKGAGVSSVFLEVREGNEAARRLYTSCGFTPTQKRRGFYQNPTEDAVLMSLKIEP